LQAVTAYASEAGETLLPRVEEDELVYPGSIMPAYDLKTNARKAIIAFVAAATAEDAQTILTQRPRPLTVQDAAIEGEIEKCLSDGSSMRMRTGGGRAGSEVKGVRDKSGLIAWDGVWESVPKLPSCVHFETGPAPPGLRNIG
jgi:hypothetical protein